MRCYFQERRQIATETRWVELLNVLAGAYWTFLLCAPVHLFRTNLAFLGMQQSHSQAWWAMLTGTITVTLLAGFVTGLTPIRCAGLWLAAGGWAYVGLNIALTATRFFGLPVNTGFGVYMALSGTNTICIFVLATYIVADTLSFYERYLRGPWLRWKIRKIAKIHAANKGDV